MSARDHVIGIDGQPIREGDRVAAATNAYRGASLILGTVRRITATRTVVEVEKSSRHRWGTTSTVDDSLGRLLKLATAPEVPTP